MQDYFFWFDFIFKVVIGSLALAWIYAMIKRFLEKDKHDVETTHFESDVESDIEK